MSVYGGDSWGREAQYRKRRVDDLLVEGLPQSSFKKLSNGKYACLVCPHAPILDTSLLLSMHSKGSRHRASESKLKERELSRENEIRRTITLSGPSIDTRGAASSTQEVGLESKPLIEQTRRITSEMLCCKTPQRSAANKSSGGGLTISSLYLSSEPFASRENSCPPATEAAGKVIAQQQLDFREHRERELKFTAAGWKRDCHGKWFRDENVEFDSDEEDPNVCLT